ncbi:integrase core domain protein [Plakobranchus ocellatus]|uniref:Integrase core domain protein n=1 Tax=Plakobranchus ocellatus TaxID=259542 RepID=A0AAV3Y1L7_9GAST|nr:integrase core domain protein [Plakobranchus ocellatus]
MQTENTGCWNKALRFVLLMGNRAFPSGIKRPPYEALFGCKAKVGLTISSLPVDVLQDVETEEELEKIIESIQTIQEQEETGEGMQGTVLSAEDTHENVIHDGGNQISSEAMVTEEPSVSTLNENPYILPVPAASV